MLNRRNWSQYLWQAMTWLGKSGFSMAELMVIVGVLGGIGLVVGQITTMNSKLLRQQSLTGEFSQLMSSLGNVATTSAACEKLLKLPLEYPSSSTCPFCVLDMSGETEIDVTVRVSGQDLSAGKKFGALELERVYLKKRTARSVRKLADGSEEYTFNADLVVVAKSSAQTGTQRLSNEGVPFNLVLTFHGGNLSSGYIGYTVTGCTGLRVEKAPQMTLQSCDQDSESVVSDGVSFKCVKKMEGPQIKLAPASPVPTCAGENDEGTIYFESGAGIKICAPTKDSSGTITGYSFKTVITDELGVMCDLYKGVLADVNWVYGSSYSVSNQFDRTVCKFSGSSCPTGWIKYSNTTTTTSVSSPGGAACGCDTGGHSFNNIPTESCTYYYGICGAAISGTATANVTEVGCILSY